MPSPNRLKVKELIILSLLIAFALVLSYFERFIPMPVAVPGVKLGLANVVTLLCLRWVKPSRIVLLIVIRVVLASIFIGSVMGLWYSLAGSLLSGLMMLGTDFMLKEHVSLIGISVVGAISHNIGQLIIVTVVTGSVYVALSYSPILMVAGVLTGIFIGLVGQLTKPYLLRSLHE